MSKRLCGVRLKLRQAIDERGGATSVAAKLGCSQPFLFLLLHGKRDPGRVLAKRIEAELGIPWTDWPNWKWAADLSKGTAA